MNELKISENNFEIHDIKTQAINEQQLTEMKHLSGSYESLFSKIARKYKDLNPKPNSEAVFKKLILEEYTFLKRPVIIIDKKIFIGNSKQTIAEAKKALEDK